MAHRTSAISSGQPRRHQHLQYIACAVAQSKKSHKCSRNRSSKSEKFTFTSTCGVTIVSKKACSLPTSLLCTRNCSNQRVWWHAASTVDSTHWRQAVPWRMTGVLLAILLMYSSMAGVCSNRIYSSTTKNCLRQTAVHLRHASVRLSAGCMSATIAVWIISRSLCDMQAWA